MVEGISDAVDFSTPLSSIDTSCLRGQSVLITGGSSGIGYAFVETCAAAGAYVTSVDLNEEVGGEQVKELVGRGLRVQFVRCDVRSWDDQIAAFEAAVDFAPSKTVDIVMPVAGLGGKNIRNWLENPLGEDGKLAKPHMDVIDVNFTGVYYTAHLALHYFRTGLKQGTTTSQAKSKQILFVSSLAGYSSMPWTPNYGGSKFGVRGIWKALREEENIVDPDGKIPFRSSLLAPFWVKTNMTKGAVPYLDSLGQPMATTDDCVDAMIRIVCDERVKGRAVAVAPKGRNFDLLDDPAGGDGGPRLREQLNAGVFGLNLAQTVEFFRHGR